MVKDFNNWSFKVISCASKETTTAQKQRLMIHKDKN